MKASECYTSPQLIAQVVKDARAKLNAGADYVQLVPMDNDQQCKCPNCQGLLDKENKSKQFSTGKASGLFWTSPALSPAKCGSPIRTSLSVHWLTTITHSRPVSTEMAWKYLGTPEPLANWAKLMEQAQAAAIAPEQKERVAIFAKDIWSEMLTGRQKWEAKQKR